MAEKQKKEETKDQDSRLYELGYHLLPVIMEEELGSEVTALRDLIEKHGGQVVSQEMPKAMALAYSLPKIIAGKRKYFDTAFFGWVRFEMLPQGAVALKDDLNGYEKILRFIIVKTSIEQPLPPRRMSFLGKGKAPRKERLSQGEKGKVLTEEEIEKTIEGLLVQ